MISQKYFFFFFAFEVGKTESKPKEILKYETETNLYLLTCSSTKRGGWELATALYHLKLSPISGQPLLPGGSLYVAFATFFFLFSNNLATKTMNNSVVIIRGHVTGLISLIISVREIQEEYKSRGLDQPDRVILDSISWIWLALL